MINIGSLREEDRAAWEVLARGYKAFYRTAVPDEGYEETWQRLRGGTEFHGLGAWSQGKLVGIAHYLFHPTFWMEDSCYLQDLFVDEAARGRGVARMLIEKVADASRERGHPASTGPLRRTTPPPAHCTTRWRASRGSYATTTHWPATWGSAGEAGRRDVRRAARVR